MHIYTFIYVHIYACIHIYIYIYVYVYIGVVIANLTIETKCDVIRALQPVGTSLWAAVVIMGEASRYIYVCKYVNICVQMYVWI
jgi:hypothetical protein